MTVSSTTTKVSYAGNGATTVFAYTFKIFAAADLEVVLRSAAGAETVQTITTHYTVSGAGADAGGNVTFVTAPASGVTVIIRRALELTQGTDYVENDPFPANSHEDALDRLTFITQQMQEELDRSIKASVTNTISTVEFSTSAADRANKLFSFDSSGDLQISQELGTYRGNWSASTLYYQRDIIKDTSNNNIYLANTQHTSTGAQPISSNADVAKWDLLVDAASAAASATSASGFADEAEAWAKKTDGEAQAGEGYSSKAWAVGGTGVTDTAAAGAAKEWATETHEGLRLAVYDDATGKPIEAGDTLVGNPTIGVGRLLTAARGISEAEAFMLLDADIAEVERQLDHHIAWWRDLDATRQRAMLSWAFNVGAGGVMQFRKALAAIRSGDWQEAHDQMLDSRWARQVPRRAKDLAELMLRG